MDVTSVWEGTNFDMAVMVRTEKAKDLPRVGLVVLLYVTGCLAGDCKQLERATGHRGPLLEEIRNSRPNVIKCYLLIAEILARLVPFTCTPSPPTSKE
jgi:hypothetical protein